MRALSVSRSLEHQFGNVLASGNDKVLASGNGKGHFYYYFNWIAALLIVSFTVWFVCFFAPTTIRENCCNTVVSDGQLGLPKMTACSSCNKGAKFCFWLGVVCVSLTVPWAAYFGSCIRHTEITVYENGITGRGVGIYFWWIGFSSLPHFQLTYDWLSSVDVTRRAIIVRAGGAVYVCYVKNPAEIQRVIVEQQRKAAGVP